MIRQRLPQKETLDKSQSRDLFKTPNYAVELLIPFIPKYINNIWEPACAGNKIIDVLSNYVRLGTDIQQGKNYNFLTMEFPKWLVRQKCAIITNPPYSLKIKFFKRCLEHEIPFALLISSDYAQWNIDAVWKYGCEKIIPNRRIDYITPTGKSGNTGNTSYFHSLWLTYGFNLGKSEVFVELTKNMKQNI